MRQEMHGSFHGNIRNANVDSRRFCGPKPQEAAGADQNSNRLRINVTFGFLYGCF